MARLFENSKEIANGLPSAAAAIPVIAQCYTPQRALETIQLLHSIHESWPQITPHRRITGTFGPRTTLAFEKGLSLKNIISQFCKYLDFSTLTTTQLTNLVFTSPPNGNSDGLVGWYYDGNATNPNFYLCEVVNPFGDRENEVRQARALMTGDLQNKINSKGRHVLRFQLKKWCDNFKNAGDVEYQKRLIGFVKKRDEEFQRRFALPKGDSNKLKKSEISNERKKYDVSLTIPELAQAGAAEFGENPKSQIRKLPLIVSWYLDELTIDDILYILQQLDCPVDRELLYLLIQLDEYAPLAPLTDHLNDFVASGGSRQQKIAGVTALNPTANDWLKTPGQPIPDDGASGMVLTLQQLTTHKLSRPGFTNIGKEFTINKNEFDRFIVLPSRSAASAENQLFQEPIFNTSAEAHAYLTYGVTGNGDVFDQSAPLNPAARVKWASYFQNTIRTPYDRYGDPDHQETVPTGRDAPSRPPQYRCPPVAFCHINYNPTPAKRAASADAASIKAAGLCCAVCSKRIVNRKQKSRWKKYLGFPHPPPPGGQQTEAPSQAFDVDHIANLIFNDLFKLNSGGHGFLNTCVQCNQSFKGEKVWCPSVNLWYHLLNIGYARALTFAPQLTKDKFYECYPWPGWTRAPGIKNQVYDSKTNSGKGFDLYCIINWYNKNAFPAELPNTLKNAGPPKREKFKLNMYIEGQGISTGTTPGVSGRTTATDACLGPVKGAQKWRTALRLEAIILDRFANIVRMGNSPPGPAPQSDDSKLQKKWGEDNDRHDLVKAIIKEENDRIKNNCAGKSGSALVKAYQKLIRNFPVIAVMEQNLVLDQTALSVGRVSVYSSTALEQQQAISAQDAARQQFKELTKANVAKTLMARREKDRAKALLPRVAGDASAFNNPYGQAEHYCEKFFRKIFDIVETTTTEKKKERMNSWRNTRPTAADNLLESAIFNKLKRSTTGKQKTLRPEVIKEIIRRIEKYFMGQMFPLMECFRFLITQAGIELHALTNAYLTMDDADKKERNLMIVLELMIDSLIELKIEYDKKKITALLSSDVGDGHFPSQSEADSPKKTLSESIVPKRKGRKKKTKKTTQLRTVPENKPLEAYSGAAQGNYSYESSSDGERGYYGDMSQDPQESQGSQGSQGSPFTPLPGYLPSPDSAQQPSPDSEQQYINNDKNGRKISLAARGLFQPELCVAHDPINSRHICATVDGNNMVVLPRVISDRRIDVAYDGNCGYHSVREAIISSPAISDYLRQGVLPAISNTDALRAFLVNKTPQTISTLIGVPYDANNPIWQSFLQVYQSNASEGKDDITPGQAAFQLQKNNGEYMRTSELRWLAVLLGVNIAFFDITGLGWEYYSADINRFNRSTLEPFDQNEMREHGGPYPTIFIWGNGGHFQWFEMLASENIWMSDERAGRVNDAVMEAIANPNKAVQAAQGAAMAQFLATDDVDGKGFIEAELMSKRLRFDRLEDEATRLAVKASLETYFEDKMKRRKAAEAAQAASTSSVPSLPPVAPSSQGKPRLKPKKPPTRKKEERRKSPRVYKQGLDPEETQRRRVAQSQARRRRERNTTLNNRRRPAKKVSKKRRSGVNGVDRYDFRARLEYGENKGFITAAKKQELYVSWMSATGTEKQLVYEEELENIISKKSRKSRGGKRTRKKKRKKEKTKRRRKYNKKTKGRKRRRKKRTRRK